MKRKTDHLAIIERLVRLETLMNNHLAHHDKLDKYILFPVLVGVIVTVISIWIKK